MDTYELLVASKSFINVNNWIQDDLAVDADSDRIRTDSNKAVAFCGLGALCHVAGVDDEDVNIDNPLYHLNCDDGIIGTIHHAINLLNETTRHYTDKSCFIALNDSELTTVTDVHEMYDRAIKYCEEGA